MRNFSLKFYFSDTIDSKLTSLLLSSWKTSSVIINLVCFWKNNISNNAGTLYLRPVMTDLKHFSKTVLNICIVQVVNGLRRYRRHRFPTDKPKWKMSLMIKWYSFNLEVRPLSAGGKYLSSYRKAKSGFRRLGNKKWNVEDFFALCGRNNVKWILLM